MENFEFLSPTKIIFGKGVEEKVGSETKKYSSKILLHYGGGSIKQSGLYDRVVKSLKEAGVEVVELPGVQPNPRLSMVREGIRICRENKIDFILAVGGGSVIDSSKAIGIGVPYEGDVWDFYSGKALPKETIPVGVVLTIPAAGSETSKSSVITNEDGWFKRGLNVNLSRPVFAITNPELTYTLPPYQTACGAADILAHIMERYFTNVTHVDLTDRLCEGAMISVIENTRIAMHEPDNYNARANVMWASSIAHNDFLEVGRIGDWASHLMEHELSGMYDVAHGAGLSVMFPAWMKYIYKHNLDRFVQFAVRVWNVEHNFYDPERTALEGIHRLEMFFHEIGLPTTLKGLGIEDDRLQELAEKCKLPNGDSLGAFVRLTRADVLNILKLAI